MNKILEKFARETLKAELAQLPSENQLIFKRMYSHTNLDKNINKVVDDMPVEKLDWTMIQVNKTLRKLTEQH